MRVETRRLILREFTQADLDAAFTHQAHGEEERYGGLADPAKLRASIRAALAAAQEEPRRVFELALILKETGQLIGRGGVAKNPVEPREGTVWFLSDPRYWNQGYITEAADGLFRVCFEELKLHRVLGECDPSNQGSLHLMEKLGMRKEAHFRENAFIGGQWKDTAVFALLDHEWREKVAAR